MDHGSGIGEFMPVGFRASILYLELKSGSVCLLVGDVKMAHQVSNGFFA